MDMNAWRAQVVEDPLDPALPIIDPHHHLWPTAPIPAFEAYDAEAMIADKGGCGHNVVATVLVEARSYYRTEGPEELRVVGETENAEKVARDALERGGKAAGLCAGIVAHADLALGARVGKVLDAHLEASPRFKGIRYITAFDLDLPDWAYRGPGVLYTSSVREGFAELARRKLTFDAWMFQPQLPELLDLARAFPETTIVLDHVGTPLAVGRFAGQRAAGFDQWKAYMSAISVCPNIVVKLGGLNMAMTGLGALGQDRPNTSEEMARLQRDVLLTTIDLFGPSRCMFESNFPVDKLSTSYGVLWNSFKRVTADFTPAERAEMFFGTANRAYRLGVTVRA